MHQAACLYGDSFPAFSRFTGKIAQPGPCHIELYHIRYPKRSHEKNIFPACRNLARFTGIPPSRGNIFLYEHSFPARGGILFLLWLVLWHQRQKLLFFILGSRGNVSHMKGQGIGSARLGSARLGSARLGSARLG